MAFAAGRLLVFLRAARFAVRRALGFAHEVEALFAFGHEDPVGVVNYEVLYMPSAINQKYPARFQCLAI